MAFCMVSTPYEENKLFNLQYLKSSFTIKWE